MKRRLDRTFESRTSPCRRLFLRLPRAAPESRRILSTRRSVRRSRSLPGSSFAALARTPPRAHPRILGFVPPRWPSPRRRGRRPAPARPVALAGGGLPVQRTPPRRCAPRVARSRPRPPRVPPLAARRGAVVASSDSAPPPPPRAPLPRAPPRARLLPPPPTTRRASPWTTSCGLESLPSKFLHHRGRRAWRPCATSRT